jgi:hypothetical protein
MIEFIKNKWILHSNLVRVKNFDGQSVVGWADPFVMTSTVQPVHTRPVDEWVHPEAGSLVDSSRVPSPI